MKPTRRDWIRLPLAALPLAGQEPDRISVDKIASGFRFADGAAWSHQGYLAFADAPNNRIHKLVPGSRDTVLREGTRGACGAAFDSNGRLYLCEARGRRVVRARPKGEPEVLAESFEGKRLNAPNDLAIRKDGHLYFTDPAFGYQSDSRELDFYGVFHLTPRRELKVVARPAGRPNGIALSPNGRVLYVANSDEHNVRAYDLDGKGEASGERVVVSGIEGVPGGLCIDSQGHLWVAGKAMLKYSPEGKLLERIEIAEPPTDCVLGDGDLKTLYITAHTSIYRVRIA